MHERNIAHEFEDAALGDARLTKRLVRIVQKLTINPGIGFPNAMKEPSEQEAFYRFCNHDNVTMAGVLAPHRQQSWSNAIRAMH